MQRLRPCRSPYTEVHSRLCTDFSFFGYARYQLGSCALRRLSAAVARLPLHCWRLWSRWLHWDQLRGSRRHPPHLLVELVLKRREPLQPLLNRSSGDAASRPLGIGWAHACAWARAWLRADAPARWSANSFLTCVRSSMTCASSVRWRVTTRITTRARWGCIVVHGLSRVPASVRG